MTLLIDDVHAADGGLYLQENGISSTELDRQA